MANLTTADHSFPQMLADAGELLRLAGRAHLLRDAGRGDPVHCLLPLLHQVLPHGPEAEVRLARAVDMPVSTLRGLRAGTVDLRYVPVRPLAMILHALNVEEDTFTALLKASCNTASVSADAASPAAAAHKSAPPTEQLLADARAVWRALELESMW